jgi:hypothetical protein
MVFTRVALATSVAIAFAVLPACGVDTAAGDGDDDADATGAATLTANGAPVRTVSAWASDVDRTHLGTAAYLPWMIYLADVPVGTACGSGEDSLRAAAGSWLSTVEIGVPATPAVASAPEVALVPGTLPVVQLSGVGPPITAPAASIEMFDHADSFVPDMLVAGTLTITAFTDEAIVGRFDATGTGTTATASATFDAVRCDD